jgi:hypothetical protein
MSNYSQAILPSIKKKIIIIVNSEINK